MLPTLEGMVAQALADSAEQYATLDPGADQATRA
ncbi:hypothetical protein JOF55_003563 [Haloactinomyces albus]|uniref:Uncharacterized protein n=1 Tax=Haloactinomyces albus TaxID=1352928 RepID=A0AAE3ZHM5_9ACTN|nr:hypothetical protein [Haloactinomyces albus]